MISAVIITKNEARNIARCLQSLQGIANEVIVLDSHSTDATPQICQQHGARFIAQDWLGYAATKNLGNSLATHPYILSMDADEAISPELRASLLAVKANLRGTYSFNRLAFYCGHPVRHGGWYPDRKLRLFPKGAAEWKGEFVHEELVANPDQPNTWLKGDLLHYTYYSVPEHWARARNYAALAAEALKGRPAGKLLIKQIFSSPWRFLQMYVIKLGFLDGKAGWNIARITTCEVWCKYSWARRKLG